MSLPLQVLPLTAPTQVRTFPRGRFEVYAIGGQQIGRAIYMPGWRWSRDVAPIAGTALCQEAHLGMVVTGRAAVAMDDGTDLEIGQGDLFSIPAGHDSWVVGEEDYVSLHLLGSDNYARNPTPDTVIAAEQESLAAVTKHNAPHFTWRDRCDGWTLVSRPTLHILQERMPPNTYELRHRHQSTAQFYYVLEGEATVNVNTRSFTIGNGEGVAIPPGSEHQMRNDSRADLEFLVMSSQPPRDDRFDVPEL